MNKHGQFWTLSGYRKVEREWWRDGNNVPKHVDVWAMMLAHTYYFYGRDDNDTCAGYMGYGQVPWTAVGYQIIIKE